MTATEADLLVIGAGPAGCAAAITAARSGRRVVVIDKAVFPRDKTCGDGLTAGALRTLESLGIPLSSLDASVPVATAIVVGPSGRRVEMPLPSDGEHARVMRRIDLDAALVRTARAAGVTVLEGATLTGLKSLDTAVEATLDDGRSLTAPFAIAADGNYSTARRLLSPQAAPVLGEWSAFRQYFAHVDDTTLWVLFERDLLPGYAWVFPLPG
ncbi:MAG: FAD-dependent monooxygenase, partial [Acidimicrobiia bacterium]